VGAERRPAGDDRRRARVPQNVGDFSLEPDEYRELNDGRVVVSPHVHARGKRAASSSSKRSGPKRGTNVFHARDCKVTRLAIYFDRDRALADLGLEG
jgi:hypothetical protein